jgi:hypothetical protein
MTKAQMKGYLLEVVLSKLIEVNGYDVITERNIPYEPSVPDNEQEIRRKNNNLNIRGRGGYHQFDTLGTFKITPPFVFPLRLFVEAKCYKKKNKVGIERVRMGLGILDDVNANYSTVHLSAEQLAIKRYQYHYAIFSTSGFSEPAQRFAIAHKINLIDLSGVEYKYIEDSLGAIVDELMLDRNEISAESFKTFKAIFLYLIYEEEIYGRNYKEFVRVIGTKLVDLILTLKEGIKNQYIYLATIESVNMIPLLANSKFNELLKSNPHQKVSIYFNPENSDEWIIVPVNDKGYEITDLSIRFILPKLLSDYMDKDTERAMAIKDKMIGKIVFVAYLDKINPTLCTLTFDKRSTLKNPWNFN